MAIYHDKPPSCGCVRFLYLPCDKLEHGNGLSMLIAWNEREHVYSFLWGRSQYCCVHIHNARFVSSTNDIIHIRISGDKANDETEGMGIATRDTKQSGFSSVLPSISIPP